MQLLRDISSRVGITRGLFGLLWQTKKWWVVPVVAGLLFLGLLIFGGDDGYRPFDYTRF